MFWKDIYIKVCIWILIDMFNVFKVVDRKKKCIKGIKNIIYMKFNLVIIFLVIIVFIDIIILREKLYK